MKFNIIGAGRLGKNIALALSTAQIALLQSVLNRTLKSGEEACLKLGSGNAVNQIDDLPPADITWITCNDDAIKSIVRHLMAHSSLKAGSLVVHCSGVLNSTLLAPLKAQGCLVASLHPLKAFRADYLDANAFNRVDCALEGDEQACTWLHRVFTALGANIISLKPETKATYHAAACLASNYLITLASCSEQLLHQSGLTQEQARQITCKLMQGNLNNLQQTAHVSESLTGPLMRGDHETLALHLQAMEDPVMKQFYKAAGLATLQLTSLTEDKKQVITQLLQPEFEG
ncbi:Rossmann-like and DUF2520 domain-containing protein [Legionella maioricensis]|uniref:DUF2520 domain-containing protein n=1 Tax=Legionella maioricensis TaxID=2896528 RepID=A0A9X2CYA3_9GAMM|nr:Rossmann-like and DUF2520 domain-containing protein [Legionella maioricensis]MCL9683095.1 DUF2520 domain-containing protein [Legionella maioricensis]MCL9686443.1 DUF2520 domain-containing protein [Legionella maioricensis]